MKHLRLLSLAALALLALATVAVSSAAAAEPAFYECAKVTGGTYEKGCGKEGSKGGYELREGIGKKHGFKGKGGAATLHTKAVKGEIKCGSLKSAGELASPTSESKIVVTFSKCTSLGKNCNSAGAKKGTITTNPLAGTLGYISKSGPIVGVDLTAESGAALAEFECEGLLTVKVTGSVIGTITPINTFSKTATSVYEVVAEEQKYTKFEGGAEDILLSEINASGPYPSGQEAAAVNKGEELEIKAS